MLCDEVRAILSAGDRCEETAHGARVVTHCLYPSFDPVEVFISKWGAGYRVTDAGGAVGAALRHGRDDQAAAAALKKAAHRHGLTLTDGVLSVEAPSADWLWAAVAGVANASAEAAKATVEAVVAAQEKAIAEQIYAALTRVVSPKLVAKEYPLRGSSGREWRVDYAVLRERHRLYVKAVSPHYNSVVSNYATFGDAPQEAGAHRFSVYTDPLKGEDEALLRQVAELVPLRAVEAGARRALAVA
jgi:hypothetical protein